MSKKTIKDLKVGESCIISNDREENPKLGGKLLSDGRVRLFLDYYFGYVMVYSESHDKMVPKKIKRREMLPITILQKPRTPKERQEYKDNLELARKKQKIQALEIDDPEKKEELKKKRATNTNLLVYFKDFVESEKVADKAVLKGALKNFKNFLVEEYPQFKDKITANSLTKEIVERFVLYLEDNHKGQGVETYYKRFKRMVNYAVDNDIIRKSPCKGVTTPRLGDMLAKDILSQEEMQQLFSTQYEGQNPEIRRAFAMTCLTGIRRCDIVRLKYSNVDYSNKLLRYRQTKTEGHSSSSGVTIPLNDALFGLIGTKPEDAPDDYIFHLPSETMCLKALRSWTKKAGIDKHITWHCGRHSFATALLSNGSNIKVVSSLLGHSTLRFTEVYVRAVDKLKEEAINSLPTLKY
jgi:site-specific recombinase XerD